MPLPNCYLFLSCKGNQYPDFGNNYFLEFLFGLTIYICIPKVNYSCACCFKLLVNLHYLNYYEFTPSIFCV